MDLPPLPLKSPVDLNKKPISASSKPPSNRTMAHLTILTEKPRKTPSQQAPVAE
jgi:hypothetical protein